MEFSRIAGEEYIGIEFTHRLQKGAFYLFVLNNTLKLTVFYGVNKDLIRGEKWVFLEKF